MNELPTELDNNRIECASILERLLVEPLWKFDAILPEKLPQQHGLYAIYATDTKSHRECLHAGASPKREQGLYARIWEDHYRWGNAGSDLVQQVMNENRIPRSDAQLWITGHCVVQWLVEEDKNLLCWAEHYMLSILRPKWGR